MIKKFPIHIQFDENDCGATCVKIILDYYGKEISLPMLKEKCFADLQGININDLSNTLNEFQFETLIAKLPIEELKKCPLPAIVLLDKGHFVVLYKIKKNKFYVSDPLFGLYAMNEKMFSERWSNYEEEGYVLLLEPTNDFVKSKNDVFSLPKLFYKRYISTNVFSFFKVLLIVVLLALSNLTFPIFTEKIVDKAIPTSNYTLIITILVAQIVIFVSGNLFNYINQKIFIKISSVISIDSISEFLNKLSKIPFKFFESKNISDIIQRIGDHTRIEQFITENLSSFIYSIITVVAFVFLLLKYNYMIFFIFLMSVFFSFLWTLYYNHQRNLIEYKRFVSYKDGMGATLDIVQGMIELKLNSADEYRIKDWKNKQKKIYSIKEEALSLENKINLGNLLISQIKSAIITFSCAFLVINKKISIGEMLSISYIIGVLDSPINNFLDFIKKWTETKFSFIRINEVNDMNEEDSEKSKIISSFNNLSIKNMCFKYNKNQKENTLSNINLEIKKGEKVAFVGLSGSGKTTLMKLLLKFHTPNKGGVYINNIELNKIKSKSWREKCGVVLQNGYIFQDTILNNIVLDKTTYCQERLKEVCRLANVDSFVENLPKKYETIIGYNGKGLSGGQMQRILIARALYKNPDVLIFDEATSSLDTYNENIIMNNIYDLDDKTMIIIAHRLSTITNADTIYVFVNGNIVEKGTHKELIALQGNYYELVENQINQ